MRLPRWLTSFVVLAVFAPPGLSQEPLADPGAAARDEGAVCRSGWEVGGEALFLVPRFESNPAFFVTTTTLAGGGLPPINTQRVEEFRYDLSVSPRVWVGYKLDSGVGARVRWFHFDHGAEERQAVNPALPLGSPVAFQSVSSTSPLMAIAPQTALPAVNSIQVPSPFGVNERLRFTSDLAIDYIDVEGTFSDIRLWSWDIDVFGGIRLARIEQDYHATSQGLVPQVLTSRQTFEGAGPLLGVEGRRRLGTTGLRFFGLGRIAFLFGEDVHESSGLNIGLIPNFTFAFHDNRSARERILPVIELEMGIEGAYPVGSAEAFIRTGVHSQLIPLGSGANGNGNAGLIGLSAAAGIRF